MEYLILAANRIMQDEQFRRFPYLDSEGITTIGYGRNLQSYGITQSEAHQLMVNNINECVNEIEKNIPLFHFINDARKVVIISMAYNIGIDGLMKFRKMLSAINSGDFELASKEMLDSQWAIQVGNRAERLALMMEKGELL